jgi:hypothetical protein
MEAWPSIVPTASNSNGRSPRNSCGRDAARSRETKVYTPQEAKLRIAEAKLNWQPGYNDAIAGRPWEQTSDGLIEVDYDQGYLEGEEKRQSCTERLGSRGIVGVR